MSRQNQIAEILRHSGVTLWGFCPFDRVKSSLLACRAKVRLPQEAKSVIVCLFPYYTGPSHGNLSRYCRVPDYHDVAGRYLKDSCERLQTSFPSYRFEGFCDNSPLPEVFAASVAGLGCIGKNGLLLHPVYGSYVFIGEIVTDLAIAENFVYREEKWNPTYCEDCGLCRNACPAAAIDDKGKCLSASTQKKRGLTQEEEDLIRQTGVIWGCDLCQEACPYNRDLPLTPIPEFRSDIRSDYCPGENPQGRAYLWRGLSVIERNYALLQRSENIDAETHKENSRPG